MVVHPATRCPATVNAGFNPAIVGTRSAVLDPHVQQILQLERALAKATARAEHAEALVDLQKKVAALLGRPLPEPDAPSGMR